MVNEIWFTFYFTHMASLVSYSFNKCKRMVRKAHVFSRERALREKFTLTRRAVPEPSSPGRLWDPWFTTQLESACINSAWKHSPSWACLKTNQTCLNQSFKKFRNFTQDLKVTQKRMQSFLSLLSSLHFLSFSSYLYKKQRNAPVLVCSRSVPPTWRTRQVSKSQGNFLNQFSRQRFLPKITPVLVDKWIKISPRFSIIVSQVSTAWADVYVLSYSLTVLMTLIVGKIKLGMMLF